MAFFDCFIFIFVQKNQRNPEENAAPLFLYYFAPEAEGPKGPRPRRAMLRTKVPPPCPPSNVNKPWPRRSLAYSKPGPRCGQNKHNGSVSISGGARIDKTVHSGTALTLASNAIVQLRTPLTPRPMLGTGLVRLLPAAILGWGVRGVGPAHYFPFYGLTFFICVLAPHMARRPLPIYPAEQVRGGVFGAT